MLLSGNGITQTDETPPAHNALGRLNREIRRQREWRGFPKQRGSTETHCAVLMEIDEAWAMGYRHLDMTEYWTWRDK
jgi:transposase-like protein